MPWLVINGCVKNFREDDPKYELLRKQQKEVVPKRKQRIKKARCDCTSEGCCSCC